MQVWAFLSVFPRLSRLLINLFWVSLTLDWKVRKTRKAFEKEVVRQGISKGDAKHLSKQIGIAKDQMMRSIWRLASK